MSAQRTVPPSRATSARLRAAALVVVTLAVVAAAYLAGRRTGAVQDVLSASPAEARRLAFIRKEPCTGGWCETIWMGKTKDDAVQVASLAAETDTATRLPGPATASALVRHQWLPASHFRRRDPDAGRAGEPHRSRRHPLVPVRAGHHVLPERSRRDVRRLPTRALGVQVGVGRGSIASC